MVSGSWLARGHTSDRTDVRAVISESCLKCPPRIARTHARPVPRDAVGWARDARRQRIDRQAHRKRHAIDALDHQQRMRRGLCLREWLLFRAIARAARRLASRVRSPAARAPRRAPADATARYAKRPCAQHPAAPFLRIGRTTACGHAQIRRPVVGKPLDDLVIFARGERCAAVHQPREKRRGRSPPFSPKS